MFEAEQDIGLWNDQHDLAAVLNVHQENALEPMLRLVELLKGEGLTHGLLSTGYRNLWLWYENEENSPVALDYAKKELEVQIICTREDSRRTAKAQAAVAKLEEAVAAKRAAKLAAQVASWTLES